MRERIRQLRKQLGMTQVKFGEPLGIKGSTVAMYETTDREPSEQVIIAICREYNVNRRWLETGEGEPFKEVTRDVEIAQFLGKVLSGDRDFKYRLASVLARLTVDEWELLERKCRELLAEDEETPGE